jgi:uncharacterized protein YjiS (DUF1127 family)
MCATTSMSEPISNRAAASVAGQLAILVRTMLSHVKQVARAYKNRRNAVELAGLDDRMLADIGLSRLDLRDAFATPLWHDPTCLMRSYALERRLSRRGVSLGLGPSHIGASPEVPAEVFHRPRLDRPARFTV